MMNFINQIYYYTNKLLPLNSAKRRYVLAFGWALILMALLFMGWFFLEDSEPPIQYIFNGLLIAVVVFLFVLIKNLMTGFRKIQATYRQRQDTKHFRQSLLLSLLAGFLGASLFIFLI